MMLSKQFSKNQEDNQILLILFDLIGVPDYFVKIVVGAEKMTEVCAC